MTVKLVAEQHFEFLSLKGGCIGWSESMLYKMSHCWKSHVTALIMIVYYITGMSEVWFIVDIMELRGYEREVGSILVSVTGIGNLFGRIIGACVRLYVK